MDLFSTSGGVASLACSRCRSTFLAFLLLGCSAAGAPTEQDNESTGTGGVGSSQGMGGTTSAAGGSGTVSGSGGTPVSTGGFTGSTGGAQGVGGSMGTAPCDDPAVLVCDDFEAHALGMEPASPWEVVLDMYNDTTSFAEVSSERAHSGTQSIKVSGGSSWGERALVGVPSAFPVANNHFFARFWAYFDGDFPSSQHLTYAIATGPIPELDPASAEEVRAGVHSGILNINFKGPTLGDPSQMSWMDPSHSVGVYPISHEWVCTEIEFDGQGHTMTFWRNDEEVSWLHVGAEEAQELGLSSGWSPEYVDFRLGWQAYGAVAMVAYYDDVVLSAERIGCTGD